MPGYKQIQVGMVTRWLSGGTPSRQISSYWEGNVPWISASTLKTIEISESDQCLTYEAVAAGSKMAPLGSTLLLVRGSALHSEIRAGLVVAPVCFNQDVKALVPNAQVFPKFLTYSLLGRAGELLRIVSSAGNTAGVLDTKLVQNFEIWLPSIAEQSAISTALGDVDALLAAQDALIAKKRAIKLGAMHELLTGKRRLPGFRGKWGMMQLGELGLVYGGLVGKSKKDFGKGDALYVPFVNVMANVILDVNSLEKVDVLQSESQNRVMKGDLLFNGSSETPEEVAMCTLVSDDVENLYLNSFCFGFRPREGVRVNGLFISYYMRAQIGRELVKSLAQGSTRYNLSKTAFLEGQLKLPCSEEQAAIVEVLGDMDSELAALGVQRAKIVQLKQGMTQVLLTGQIRLI